MKMRLGFFGSNVDATSLLIEEYASIDKRENRVVTPHAYALTGMPFGTALADNDVAGDDGLTTEFLHAETLALRIATVAYGTLTFLMSHLK